MTGKIHKYVQTRKEQRCIETDLHLSGFSGQFNQGLTILFIPYSKIQSLEIRISENRLSRRPFMCNTDKNPLVCLDTHQAHKKQSH